MAEYNITVRSTRILFLRILMRSTVAGVGGRTGGSVQVQVCGGLGQHDVLRTVLGAFEVGELGV
jgi:hypothetical protein